MRVVCDQCAATYKVPNAKLTKPINKATCRQCNSRLLIPQAADKADEDERIVVPAIPPSDSEGLAVGGLVTPATEDDDDKTVPVVRRSKGKHSTEGDDVALAGSPLSGADRDMVARLRGGSAPTPAPAAPAPAAPAPAPVSAAPPAPVVPQAAVAPLVTAEDLAPGTLFAGGALAVVGTLLTASHGIELLFGAGVFLAAFGSTLVLFVLFTSMLGTKPAKPILALGGSVPVAGLFTALVVMLHFGGDAPSKPAAVAAAPEAPAEVPASAPEAPADGVAAVEEAPEEEEVVEAVEEAPVEVEEAPEEAPAPATHALKRPVAVDHADPLRARSRAGPCAGPGPGPCACPGPCPGPCPGSCSRAPRLPRLLRLRRPPSPRLRPRPAPPAAPAPRCPPACRPRCSPRSSTTTST